MPFGTFEKKVSETFLLTACGNVSYQHILKRYLSRAPINRCNILIGVLLFYALDVASRRDLISVLVLMNPSRAIRFIRGCD